MNCPRCAGPLYLDHEYSEVACLMCGWRELPILTLPKARLTLPKAHRQSKGAMR